MIRKFISATFFLTLITHLSFGQQYDLVITGGHVIDPKNNVNQVMDVAVKNGKIAAVKPRIDTQGVATVISAKGLYVVPGIIDIHAHVFYGNNIDQYLMDGTVAVVPDGFTFRSGVTTVADAGSAGWRNFELFKRNVIDRSRTRVLSFLNIVGAGMRGGPYEQNVKDMDAHKAAETAERFKDDIVGFKVAHYEDADWTPVDSAVAAGKITGLPVMVDFGGSDKHEPLSIKELFFDHLRPGDIYTHTFTELKRRDPIVDLFTRKLKDFVPEAQKRGIIFDVGFGGGSFNFQQAIPAMKTGFRPNSISTDLHTGSMNAGMKDMLNIMSIFLALDMNLQDVIKASTWSPANYIQRTELGHLSEGAVADIAILGLRTGDFGFYDVAGYRVAGQKRLECEATLKDGRVMYDLNGISRGSAHRPVMTMRQTK